MKSIFGESARTVALSSTKGHLGHALGASGSIEMIFTILSCYNIVIPPTINLDTPDPNCDLDYLPNYARQMPVKIAMNNSFGFGGHNATVICGKVQ